MSLPSSTGKREKSQSDATEGVRQAHHRLVSSRQPTFAAIAEKGKRLLGASKEPHAFGRQAHAARLTGKQADAEPALQPRDLPRNRAMGDAAFFGSRRK
jgi:hypothetical protein